jgi:RNA polymerase sigma factor (sigma-70 family)|tara:strand:- start:11383 stop:12066 length:684 start_codon:yes stop_codon:yes gene_type:complete
MSKKKLEFEECIEKIDHEITKRKNKWNLTAISWMDFDDVSQILRIHIFKKWHLYDQSQPLAPWLNRIISNQIKNLVRNNYGNYSRPCLKCAAAESSDLCKIYGKQDSTCPLYANWEKTKKVAHDVKIPLPLENHSQEVFNMSEDKVDLQRNIDKIHSKMQEVLKPLEWKIYQCLYIENLTEEQTAKKMGYKTTEKNRSPGYKQIKNIQKIIIAKVKKNLDTGEIDII